MNDITVLPGSDPAGKVILSNNKVYRGINKDFVTEYRNIYYTCLQNNLFGRHIIPTKIANDFKLEPFVLLFEHERVKPYIYPFEWTLSMTIDAAYMVLNLVISLDKIGLGLKDGHQFNTAYYAGNFYWIDFCSIIQHKTLSWMFEEFMDAFLDAIICMANGVHHSDTIYDYLTEENQRKYIALRTMILEYSHTGAVIKAAQLLYQWIRLYEAELKIISYHSTIPDVMLSSILRFIKERQIQEALLISGEFSNVCFALNQNNIAVTVFHKDPKYIDFIYSQIKGKATRISPVLIDFLNPNSANNESKWLEAEKRFPAEIVIVFQYFSTADPIDFIVLVKKLKAFTTSCAVIEVIHPCSHELLAAIAQEFDIIMTAEESYHQNKKLLFLKVK